ncbi:MAG: peptide chain release factor N(5)-glutamine methyltransferase [Rhodocyclaceae bacterium]|nr:peptide chain release factor N(5)-glutamine methyltransferase [Rhodocyclaceae bacterium]
MNRIAAALTAARQTIPLTEARLLLRHLLGCSPAWLEAHRDDALDAARAEAFAALVARRAAGEPIAYLVGTREFYGRDFAVTPAVLIPRPETELLVDLGRQAVAGLPAPRILDLGTGSGCVAVTLALELPGAEVAAVDVSAAALAVAQGNAERLGAKVRFAQSDWFAALGGECFDLIVANPPYIAAGDRHLAEGDLRFEPPQALACGVDGLDAIRHIVAAAPQYLRPGGRLYFEHGYDQAEAIAALLSAAGYAAIEQHRDLAGIVRVSGGKTALRSP